MKDCLVQYSQHPRQVELLTQAIPLYAAAHSAESPRFHYHQGAVIGGGRRRLQAGRDRALNMTTNNCSPSLSCSHYSFTAIHAHAGHACDSFLFLSTVDHNSKLHESSINHLSCPPLTFYCTYFPPTSPPLTPPPADTSTTHEAPATKPLLPPQSELAQHRPRPVASTSTASFEPFRNRSCFLRRAHAESQTGVDRRE